MLPHWFNAILAIPTYFFTIDQISAIKSKWYSIDQITIIVGNAKFYVKYGIAIFWLEFWHAIGEEFCGGSAIIWIWQFIHANGVALRMVKSEF